MDKESLQLLNGMLKLDPNKRFTAVDCLAAPWFDSIREEEVERLIKVHQQVKEQ
jgi:serine/threonine protein kinase